MPFSAEPDRKQLSRFPDKAELGQPLRVPDVHTVHLRFSQEGGRTVASWRIPWVAVTFTFVVAFGSVTAGLLYGRAIGRLEDPLGFVLLGVIWGLMAPLVVAIFYRAFHRALTRKRHLVLDPERREFVVSCVGDEDATIAFDDVLALVHVSRMVETGHGRGLWKRHDEFSIAFRTNAGEHVQLPLYGIRDVSKREEPLRRWTNELPRLLGCERIRVAFDRKGQLQGSGG